jgi:hypothetical protein
LRRNIPRPLNKKRNPPHLESAKAVSRAGAEKENPSKNGGTGVMDEGKVNMGTDHLEVLIALGLLLKEGTTK